MPKKVLVAGEYSGRVRDAFIKQGHDAVSVDLLPSEAPGPHIQGDVRDVMNDKSFGWDMMIAHPPCTHLSCSGARYWQGKEKEQAEALEFVQELMDADIPQIAIENPIGKINTAIRKPDQIVQPYEFGDDASKRTAFWLKGMPKLEIDPAKRKPGRTVHWEGKERERWANQTDSGQNKLPPSPDRGKKRSLTFPGMADEMAAQWGRADTPKKEGVSLVKPAAAGAAVAGSQSSLAEVLRRPNPEAIPAKHPRTAAALGHVGNVDTPLGDVRDVVPGYSWAERMASGQRSNPEQLVGTALELTPIPAMGGATPLSRALRNR